MIYTKYKTLADYISELLGVNTEVILHDFSDIEHSIVYILNNHITGRNIGDTATDLLLKHLNNKEHQENGFLTNYSSVSKSGILLHSSTFFIKNDKGDMIGALCTNTDLTTYNNAIKSIINFIPNATILENLAKDTHKDIKETFYDSPGTMTLDKIQTELLKSNIPPERMSPEERAEIVARLYKMGIFVLKGSVQKTAQQLKTSEASIYRYIRSLKNSDKKAE